MTSFIDKLWTFLTGSNAMPTKALSSFENKQTILSLSSTYPATAKPETVIESHKKIFKNPDLQFKITHNADGGFTLDLIVPKGGLVLKNEYKMK